MLDVLAEFNTRGLCDYCLFLLSSAGSDLPFAFCTVEILHGINRHLAGKIFLIALLDTTV